MQLVCSILLPSGYVGAAFVLKIRNNMDVDQEVYSCVQVRTIGLYQLLSKESWYILLRVTIGPFTPKRTKSQFRAGARASSKLVLALSQVWTSWIHTGQSQPWSRREQPHEVIANVWLRLRFPSNPRALPELYNKKKNRCASFKHNNNKFVFDSIRVWFVLWTFRFKTNSEKTINSSFLVFRIWFWSGKRAKGIN